MRRDFCIMHARDCRSDGTATLAIALDAKKLRLQPPVPTKGGNLVEEKAI